MNPKIIAIIIGVILFVMIWNRKKTDKIINEFIMDTITKSKIMELHPALRAKATELIKRAEKEGIKLRIYNAMRSYEQQQKLFNQPWDLIDNDGDGQVDESDEKVTNAKGGESFHNFGLAFDTVEIKDGKAVWNNPRWNRIGEIGESLGLVWGGRWKFVDKPHFQIMDFPLSHAQRNYNNKLFDKDGYIKLT